MSNAELTELLHRSLINSLFERIMSNPAEQSNAVLEQPRAKKPRVETAWTRHVDAFKVEHPGMKLKDVLKEAKLTYVKPEKPVKVKKEGEAPAPVVEGGEEKSAAPDLR